MSKVDHIAYRVADIDKISSLLQQLGYVELRRTKHHGGAVELENPKQPGLVLEFTINRKDEVSGFDHVCFKLDGEEELNELIANDFPIDGEPHLSPDAGRFIVNFKDADGTKWQLTW